VLDLGAVTRGPLTLTAGPQAVTWTLSASDGITVLAAGVPVTGGTLVPGQELDLTVIAPTGKGWIYVSFGGTTVPVEVTSDLGTPALAGL
jgi:FtsP/CotA-like multicopper oxidase with cupredoxin domain